MYYYLEHNKSLKHKTHLLQDVQNFVVSIFVFRFSNVQEALDELRLQKLFDQIQGNGKVFCVDLRHFLCHLHHVVHAFQKPKRHFEGGRR